MPTRNGLKLISQLTTPVSEMVNANQMPVESTRVSLNAVDHTQIATIENVC